MQNTGKATSEKIKNKTESDFYLLGHQRLIAKREKIYFSQRLVHPCMTVCEYKWLETRLSYLDIGRMGLVAIQLEEQETDLV